MISRMVAKKLVCSVALLVIAAFVGWDLVSANRSQTSAWRIPWEAMGTGVLSDGTSVVAIACSECDELTSKAPRTDSLTTEQVDEVVKLAIHRDTSERNLANTIDPGDWVAIKVNIVTAPLVINGRMAFHLDGQTTDLRVVKSVIDYLVNEERDARRITIVEGATGWAKIGMPGSDPKQTEDGWTVHWNAYGGLSYSDIVNQYNGVKGITVDIVDLNYDEWVTAPDGGPLPVPPGPNAAGPTWYQRPEGFYVSKTLYNVDKLINIPAMKTHNIPGVTLIHKNYVGTFMQRAHGYDENGKGGLHTLGGVRVDSKVPQGFVDLFSYRPTNYGIIEGFYGMQENGEYFGLDLQWNLVVASGDPVAAEAVAATIMGYNPDDLGFLHMSAAKGFGTLDLEQITTMGDPIETVARRFKKPGEFVQEKTKWINIPLVYGRGNREWLVNGPYPGDIETEAIPEAASLIPIEGEMTKERAWERLVGEERAVDFTKCVGTNTVTYAFTIIRSKTDQTGLLFVGGDDGVQIWLNGQEILKQAKLPLKPSKQALGKMTDGVRVPINLRQGMNPLMVKLVNALGGAELALIPGNEDGDTLPGVSYSLTLPVTAVEDDAGRQAPTARPEQFVLWQNVPNPFNPDTTIPYVLPQTALVRLSVHDPSGQVVRTLVDGVVPAGGHLMRWDGKDDAGRDVASGPYLARLQAGSVVRAVKMLLVR